jgi:hypothetical protein
MAAPRLLQAQDSSAASPQPCHLFCVAGRAAQALNAKEHAEYLRLSREVARLARDHPGGIYAVAQAFALTGQRDSAIAWLSRLADIGATHDVRADSAFPSLSAMPDFGSVAARLEQNAAPVTRGRVAFTVPDADLLPEALAWDPARRRWLVGSQPRRTILARSEDGTWSDVVADPRMLRVLGIHADTARHRLWFATWQPAHPQPDSNPDRRRARGRLFSADLRTGAILRAYDAPDTSRQHLLNDLAVVPDGSVYVTDNRANVIYHVRPGADSLETFAEPDPSRFTAPNGIAVSGDGQSLYVAFLEGIARLDLATRRMEYLPTPRDVSTAGIDGLYWYRGDLVAVQNPARLRRVVRFRLDDAGNAVVGADVLERGDAMLGIPTTGTVVGDRFYYVANSQIDRLADDDRLRPAATSPPPLTVVRVVELSPSG